MELQVAARDTDIDLSPFSVIEMDYVWACTFKIRALYFHCGFLLMDFMCGSGI